VYCFLSVVTKKTISISHIIRPSDTNSNTISMLGAWLLLTTYKNLPTPTQMAVLSTTYVSNKCVFLHPQFACAESAE